METKYSIKVYLEVKHVISFKHVNSDFNYSSNSENK